MTYFGRTVNLAARIANTRSPGRPLVSTHVAGMIRPKTLLHHRRRPGPAEGVADPINLHAVEREASRQAPPTQVPTRCSSSDLAHGDQGPWDVAVIGLGVTGLSTAGALARRGDAVAASTGGGAVIPSRRPPAHHGRSESPTTMRATSGSPGRRSWGGAVSRRRRPSRCWSRPAGRPRARREARRPGRRDAGDRRAVRRARCDWAPGSIPEIAMRPGERGAVRRRSGHGAADAANAN